MCFALYMATDREVRGISWKEDQPALFILETGDNDRGVSKHFTKPFLRYVGSDQGCGCGFRHVMFQGGGWPEESIINPDESVDEDRQTNHRQLHEVLTSLPEDCRCVELYGCWEGDFDEACEGTAEIRVDDILEPAFHFRERFGYVVRR